MSTQPEFESVKTVYSYRDLSDDFAAAIRGNPDVWWKVPDLLEDYNFGDRYNVIGMKFGDVAAVEQNDCHGNLYVRYLGEWKELKREYDNFRRAQRLNEPYEFEKVVSLGEGKTTGVWFNHVPVAEKPKTEVVPAKPKRRWWK